MFYEITRDRYDLTTNLVKSVTETIIVFSSNVINKCIAYNYFPDSLKLAKVSPLYKQEVTKDINSDRLIPLYLSFPEYWRNFWLLK